MRALLETQLGAKLARRRQKMQAHRFVRFRAITFNMMQAHVRPSHSLR